MIKRLRAYIAGRFEAKTGAEPRDVETLRIDFKDRYRAFRLLLAANRKALGLMAGMEERLAGGVPFGMPFVRSCTTSVSVSVYTMVQQLDRLSRGRYGELYDRYDRIQERIGNLLAERLPDPGDALVLPLDAVNASMGAGTGGKMAGLGEIRQALGIDVPDGFVTTTAAWHLFVAENDLKAEIDSCFQSADAEDAEQLFRLCSTVQQRILKARVPRKLADAMTTAAAALAGRRPGPLRLALRSSAVGEDGDGHSFAGQYRSVLNIGPESLLQAFREVMAGKYSLQAVAYRLRNGIRDEDTPMCVGCLAMVAARAGGVIYTRSPVDPGEDAVLINSVWGLPKAVVDGTESCDLTVVSREADGRILRRVPAEKPHQFVCLAEEGCQAEALPAGRRQAMSLDPEQAIELAGLALRIEAHFGVPQDIEWALEPGGDIRILQCRPMTALEQPPAAALATDAVPLIHAEGVTASRGIAAGPVVRVAKDADLLAFPEGGVLVARQALPRWASLLGRAAAVVTEQGGFAGHLASVAREFGVPAVFGVPGAMGRLEAGAAVTVDADGRAIYPGRLALDPPGKKASAGAPDNAVTALLRAIARHVVPLNLLEPDAVDFTAGHCRSLHDITRFVHEKAVGEMFSFGRDHRFSERSSKQLHFRVPMQWWVLDLDDGFRRPVTGRFVRLAQVRSIPMLMFWKGYTAVPWEGPPLDRGGLMAVMFRSTMNPALTPGVRSPYAERNYFMISRNYCSLSSRLGYHFATMEALVGPRIAENYVSFQFKGGAADFDRRKKRVLFIRDLLETFDFRVEVRRDHLSSRIAEAPAAFVAARIRILGYLLLHTRQLDMIMANPASVSHYRRTLLEHMQALLETPSYKQV